MPLALVLAGSAAAGAASAQVVFRDTFGTSQNRVASPHVPSEYIPTVGLDDSKAAPFSHGGRHYRFAEPTYREGCASNATCYYNASMINDGYYAVVPPSRIDDTLSGMPSGWSLWWNLNVRDYTPEDGGNGAALVVNAGTVRNEFYHRTAELEAGTTYRLSVAQYVVKGPSSFRIEIQDGNPSDSVKVLAYSQEFAHADPNTGKGWTNYTWKFTVPQSCAATAPFTMGLRNMSARNDGNDFYVDDITLEKVAYDPAATTWSGSECPKPLPVDLSISKDNGEAAVVAGQPTRYRLVVSNAGPGAADGAVVRDTPDGHLDCVHPPAALQCSGSGGAQCPAQLDPGALTSGDGLVVPVLPAGGSLSLELTCKVLALQGD